MRACFAVAVVLVAFGLSGKAGVVQHRPRILVDASKSSYTWWYPMDSTNADPRQSHWGKPFVDYLKGRGADVEELRASLFAGRANRNPVITATLLEGRDLVVRPGGREYTDITTRVLGQDVRGGEIGAYLDYVRNGGKVLLLSDNIHPRRRDSLATAFGIRFDGVIRGEGRLSRFEPHPITRNVKALPYGDGTGLVGTPPPGMKILGFLSNRTFLDVDWDGKKGRNEPAGAGTLGVLEFGRGVVVFVGSVTLLESKPQPLTDNILNFLLGPQ